MNSTKSQRELLKQQREQQKRKQLITIIIGVVVVVAVFAVIYFLPRMRKNQCLCQSKTVPPLAIQRPIKVNSFSNFTCSHCRLRA